jgi:hypothetical protein
LYFYESGAYELDGYQGASLIHGKGVKGFKGFLTVAKNL